MSTRPLKSEKEVQDITIRKELYKFAPDEKPSEKLARHQQASKDISDRLMEHAKYTGKVYDFNRNRTAIQISALINLLIRKKMITNEEFADCFWISANETVTMIEANRENDKREMLGNKLLDKRGLKLN